mmetsp:Transcript_41932/g.78408  ORF Transcript_41932/g.78408 Transcript_41932/m.78408 type:complete len:157 (-) Transcript_41932:33-503(-)
MQGLVPGCLCLGGTCVVGIGTALWFAKPGQRLKRLDASAQKSILALWDAMNTDKDNKITREEADVFFKKIRFGKLSVDAMFSEVDTNADGEINQQEWVSFWEQVKGNGYTDALIVEEVENMMKGEAWVDWLDNRDVGHQARSTKNADSRKVIGGFS